MKTLRKKAHKTYKKKKKQSRMQTERVILEKLGEIERQVKEIKEHMIDVDTILDQDDVKSIEEAEKDLREGKTTSLEQLKKELGF